MNPKKSKEVKFKVELPSVVFPSEVEEEVGMLGKAAPVSGEFIVITNLIRHLLSLNFKNVLI